MEKQAKLQKSSLKNYLEFTLEDTAMRYSEPSEEYKKTMDDIIDRMEKGEVNFTLVSEALKKYGKKL